MEFFFKGDWIGLSIYLDVLVTSRELLAKIVIFQLLLVRFDDHQMVG